MVLAENWQYYLLNRIQLLFAGTWTKMEMKKQNKCLKSEDINVFIRIRELKMYTYICEFFWLN